MLGLGDLFKKKSVMNPPNEHRSLLVQRAKMLIEELVSPLDEPNQEVIDELLTIIQQTTSLPSHLINKEQVLKTAKGLLYQLIKPIPNPNKKLIHELLLILTNPDKALQKPLEEKKEEHENKQPVGNDEQSLHQSSASSQEQTTASPSAQAQQTSVQPSVSNEELKKQKTVMNLILQQIKELITITNNLNGKIKSFEPRVEAMEKVVGEIKEKNETFEKKLSDFERNMEKFIGLYEVVTNQFNPFVETGQDVDDFTSDTPQEQSAEDIDKRLAALENAQADLQERSENSGEKKGNAKNPQSLSPSQQGITPTDQQSQSQSLAMSSSHQSQGQTQESIPQNSSQAQPTAQPSPLIINNTLITSPQQLEDVLLNLSDDVFLQFREQILTWLQQTDQKLYAVLTDKQTRKEFTKALMLNLP